MLTSNWKKLIRGGLTYTISCNDVPRAMKTITLNNTGGTAFNFTHGSMSSYEDDWTNCVTLGHFGTYYTGSSSSDYYTVFGNGSTPPTEDDIWLSGDRITNIGVSSVVSSTINDDGSVCKTAVFTISNKSTTDDITISEVGTCDYITSYVLLDRTLLDEPVTIPAGGVGQITYTINFNIA